MWALAWSARWSDAYGSRQCIDAGTQVFSILRDTRMDLSHAAMTGGPPGASALVLAMRDPSPALLALLMGSGLSDTTLERARAEAAAVVADKGNDVAAVVLAAARDTARRRKPALPHCRYPQWAASVAARSGFSRTRTAAQTKKFSRAARFT